MKTAVFLYHKKCLSAHTKQWRGGLSAFGNTEEADVLCSAVRCDSCKKSGKNGNRDIGEGGSRDDDQTERGCVPENLKQIAYAVDLAEERIVLIEISENVDDVQKEAGDGCHESHI